MDKNEVVLAALAAGDGAEHSPVQVQKLLFLIDKAVGTILGGPFFSFTPYHYGPFDAEVYQTLERLELAGDAKVHWYGSRYRTYRLSTTGQQKGADILSALDDSVSDYLRRLSRWVRSLTFQQLVSAIYEKYPEMRVNSVFSEAK